MVVVSFIVVLPCVGIITIVERRVLGVAHRRHAVGWLGYGWLHLVVDGSKTLGKRWSVGIHGEVFYSYMWYAMPTCICYGLNSGYRYTPSPVWDSCMGGHYDTRMLV